MGIDQRALKYASSNELAEYERLLTLAQDLKDPLTLGVAIKGLTPYPHQQLIVDHIMALLEHRLYPSGIGPLARQTRSGDWVHPLTEEKAVWNLALSTPPRAGKSEIVSTFLPLWFILRNPDKQVILASASGDFAADWGAKVKNLLHEHPEYGIYLDRRREAAFRWYVKGHDGGMYTAGAGGQITGKGAYLLICDDPIKSNEDVEQAKRRDKQEDWWHSTFSNRGNFGEVPKVLMHTRWHDDDLVGRFTKKFPQDWFYLNIPAISFDEVDSQGVSIDPDTGQRDPLGRGPGQSICPEMHPIAQLRTRQANDPHWFSAMYQGKPTIAGGDMFKRASFGRFRQIKEGIVLIPPSGDQIFLSKEDFKYKFGCADMANTVKTKSDYTAIGAFQVTTGHHLLVRNITRDKIEGPEHEKFVRAYYKKWDLKFLGIEDRTFGSSLIQHLLRNGKIVIRKLKADKDKISRAISPAEVVSNGQVYLPENEPWVEDFLDEITRFPNAAHDDMVDIFVYAVDIWEKMPGEKRTDFPDTSQKGRMDYQRERLREAALKKKKRFHPIVGRWI